MTKKTKLPKIFTLEYLANEELSEEDLFCIFEQHSLFYSLVKEMFIYSGEFTAFPGIYEKIHETHNWVNTRHFKTRHDQQEFIERGTKAIKNVYQISYDSALKSMQNFMIKYGFSLSTIKRRRR